MDFVHITLVRGVNKLDILTMTCLQKLLPINEALVLSLPAEFLNYSWNEILAQISLIWLHTMVHGYMVNTLGNT